MSEIRRRLATFALSLAGLAFFSCGNEADGQLESDGRFERDGFPFTFEYPEDFKETADVHFTANLGDAAEQAAAVVISENDAIAVQRFTLNLAIDDSNLGLAKDELDTLLRQIDPDVSMRPSQVAGLPALTTDTLEVRSIEGGRSRLTVFFDGDQEYVINCQSTPAHRAEVDEACDLALETLTLDE